MKIPSFISAYQSGSGRSMILDHAAGVPYSLQVLPEALGENDEQSMV